ncbi:MAG: class A beta-lactamase-related serine hydrolase [Candidatus Parcubacteria bacterium]|nr:class A beta-lactamase-related serine hydrolase [Candidatus Parcubacteria bacterium]
MTKKKIILGALIILVVGIIVGRLDTVLFPTKSAPREVTFINPAVTSNLNKHFIINFKPLKDQLTAIQAAYHQKTYIYFDYLNNASWIGLNEKDDFTAASTIKIPLAMAMFKAAEEGKIKLTDTYSLESLGLDAGDSALAHLGANKQFTVEELIRVMLQTSDNVATIALNSIFERIGIDGPFADVYSALGWENNATVLIPANGQPFNYQKINLKTLSNMFLALYNASYVNIEHSQQILSYLAYSSSADKITVGTPSTILIAHKVGISTTDNTFSDCGIIYAPSRNYLLCLGSTGSDEKTANQFMTEISQAVYQFIINN